MQQVDCLEKAKRFMKSTVTTALVVMALATATNMQAVVMDPSTILPVASDPYCYASTGTDGAPCGGGAAQLPQSNSIAGVKLYTTEPVLFSTSSSGLSTLILMSRGALIGSLLKDTVIPISYEFEIGSVGPAGSSVEIGTWTVSIGMLGAPTYGAVSSSIWMLGAGAIALSGASTVAMTKDVAEGTILQLEADFRIEWMSRNGGQLSINVPQNSIDFNAVPDSSVPEPGSLSLLAGGLALLGWKIGRHHRI